jgi:UDP-2,4-diacetamido-2,4,6-trideoxy-beta-L-altropyranose hydrolase
MRCLALAEALRSHDSAITLITRSLSPSLAELWQALGAQVHAFGDVQDDAAATAQAVGAAGCDAIVVDHYSMDVTWERALRPACRVLMAIDDLAGRTHAVDLLLDQNLGRRSTDYDPLLPPETQRLIGPDFALLRSDFSRLRATSLARRAEGRLGRVLVSMGGSDPDQATARVLHALSACALPADAHITVVLGALAPTRQQVESAAGRLPWPAEVKFDVRDMARLMAESDLAIGAAGSSAWERCCLGLPALMLVLAENQREAATALQTAGAAALLPSMASLAKDLPRCVGTLAREPERLCRMSACAAQVIDGRGAQRVAEAILRKCASTSSLEH